MWETKIHHSEIEGLGCFTQLQLDGYFEPTDYVTITEGHINSISEYIPPEHYEAAAKVMAANIEVIDTDGSLIYNDCYEEMAEGIIAHFGC